VLNVDGDSAGLYDMGVLPRARRRGYGRALTLAALAHARDLGCASVTLNATAEGELLYRSVGFSSLGLGMTWWLFPR
jgi:ribosomal protein S18 acetylase RimI-like enzyme